MAGPSAQEEMDWQAVIGRSLAFLCLHYGELRAATLLEQAEFLARLGFPRSEAAVLLGTTDASLAEMARQKRKRSKGGRRGTAKKASIAKRGGRPGSRPPR